MAFFWQPQTKDGR